MLWLERLDLNGFKSFPERTEIEFPQGICAVVGPNGCGKSNIADAIQWVLGEQSARALRGLRMEDVIFAGSSVRDAAGLAEVTLHLVSRNGPLPDGRTRVAVSRRLFRTGESEYLIDGKRSRLTDLRALFDQARVGVRSYAVIDQGHIASFVVSKPRERRVFIEEAAGIAGYKQRRRQAELKLEATRANLLRVDDIIDEVERQQRSLKRQASHARRARRLQERLRRLRTVWYRRRDAALGAQLAELEEGLAVHGRERDHLEQERSRIAALLGAARRELEEGHGERDRASEAAHQATLEEQRLERERAGSLARIEALEQDVQRRADETVQLEEERARRVAELGERREGRRKLGEEIAALETQLAEASQAAEQASAEHERLQAEASRLESVLYEHVHRRAEVSSGLSRAREAVDRERQRAEEAAASRERLAHGREAAEDGLHRARASVQHAEAERQKLQERVTEAHAQEERAVARLEEARAEEGRVAAELGSREGEKGALESLEVRYAGAEPLQELMEKARERMPSLRVVADVVRVDKEVERAAESFLADMLPTVLVDSPEAAVTGAQLELRGRVRFLPLDAPSLTGGTGAGEMPQPLGEDPRVRGRLRSWVSAEGDVNGAVTSRLEDAVLVDRLETALELQRRHPGWSFVTPEGHVAAANGIVTVAGRGEGNGDGGLLTRARRREELSREVERLREVRGGALAAIESRREELRAAQQARRELEESLAEAGRALSASRVAFEQAGRELERVESDLERARLAGEAAERARAEAEQLAEESEQKVAEEERRIEAARAELEEAREAVRRHQDVVRRASLEHSERVSERRALEERRLAADRDLERLQAELQRVDARRDEDRRAAEASTQEAEELKDRLESLDHALCVAGEQRADAASRAAEQERRLEAAGARVRELEERLDRVSEELEGARGRREAAALEAERARLAREHERDSCRAELGCAPDELTEDPRDEIEPELLESDALLRQEVESVQDKQQRLGPVNLLAEQEFEELEQRHDELTRQRDDLRESIDELNDSIRRTNRESRERFMEAFGQIRRHFRARFQTLFRGGRADIHLDDESNVLEAGIEVVCQPPGKKLQSVTLLSGGEKALAATAILFAIFDYQVPPFCVLDEIDAPLDDNNVGRFTEVVREFSNRTQIVLITHNKRSMEMADLLYGVTMPQPGVSRMVSMTLD
jgi:chromosome segregation protein